LASAGVRRLRSDLSEFDVIRLDPIKFVPSPGQGILAIQMRVGDKNFDAIKNAINDENSEAAAKIERKVLADFGGGCGFPLGAYARKVADKWYAYGFWGGNSGKPIWADAKGHDLDKVGEELFNALSSET
jgi:porphobilinogen deaminase